MTKKAPPNPQCKMRETTAKESDAIKEEIISFKTWLDNQYNKNLYKKYRIKKPLSKTTKKNIIKWVRKILKDIGKRPEEINEKDIMKYREMCLRNYEPNGINNRFQALNYLLKYLGHEEWRLKLVPTPRKRYETLNNMERKKLIETANHMKPLDKAIIFLLLEGICRPVDIQNIKIKNIRFEEHKILLEQSKTGEYIKRRGDIDAIFMTPRIEEAIKEYLKIRKKILPRKKEYEEYLFLHPWNKNYGKPIGYEKIRKTLKKAVAMAQINKKVTPYTLKRTEITREFDRGVNPEVIRIRARHRRIETTLLYDNKKEDEIANYLFSEQYNDDVTAFPIEEQKKILADRLIKGEITLEDFNKLLSVLEKKSSIKKESYIGYV
ncbi:MAG TPA: site-specific integrase [Thermoplasmatales archaeon]|nr:site-specific integrase [Thermoplasmatales archaeon]